MNQMTSLTERAVASSSVAIPHSAMISDSRDKAQTDELHALFQRSSFEQHFQPDSTVLLHGDRAEAIYLVVSGMVRCCTINAYGSRQIFSFSTKGMFIGLSDMDRWHFTAEAVDHVILRSIPKAKLEQQLAVNIPLRQEIRAHVQGLLVQRERQLLNLSSTKGPDRLHQFLVEYAAKRRASGFVVLPMCRRDIGDHIGLSTEGVSRAFSRLKDQGAIELKSSEKYRIVDRSCGRSPELSMPEHV